VAPVQPAPLTLAVHMRMADNRSKAICELWGEHMTIVKLSSKNQIVLPREAREAMKVDKGAQLLVFIRGGTTVIIPKPRQYSRTLAGRAKGLYPRDYVAKERQSW